jgi:hypothetical protein
VDELVKVVGRWGRSTRMAHRRSLPRISCRELRLQSAACGSLWREHIRGAVASREAGNSASLLMTQREGTIGLVPRLRRSDRLRDPFPSPSGLG